MSPVGKTESQLNRIALIDEAFAPVDEKDWDHLFANIPDSGHGQFWKQVLSKARQALTPDR